MLWTKGQLRMSRQKTFWDTDNVISSVESADGLSPCNLQAGQTNGQYGLDQPRASHSLPQANKQVLTTIATCGPSSTDSFAGGDHQSCSESKSQVRELSDELAERMGQILMRDQYGSMEYALTWRRHITPAGRVIYRLRASGHRTSGKGCGGSQETQQDLFGYSGRDANGT